MWDGGTWIIVGLTAVACGWPCFIDDGILPVVICLVALAFMLGTFLSICYKIDTDRKILKSYMPLIISPVRQDEFIRQLLAINPEIKHQSNPEIRH